MTKALALIISILIGVNIAFAQNSYDVTSRVKVSEIKNKEFREAFTSFQHNSFLKLPINYDCNYSRNDSARTKEQLMLRRKKRPYPYRDSSSPFYVNLNRRDKERNDFETIFRLIDGANGNYIIGIVEAISAFHDIKKAWLVTFNFSGYRIANLPIGEYPGMRAATIEAQINKDFTVDVQQLDFPDNDYIIRYDSINMTFNYLDKLKGQRIDTKYQVTPEGKFELLEEIRYQPQIYTPEMLLEGERKHSGEKWITIRQRNEKRM